MTGLDIAATEHERLFAALPQAVRKPGQPRRYWRNPGTLEACAAMQLFLADRCRITSDISMKRDALTDERQFSLRVTICGRARIARPSDAIIFDGEMNPLVLERCEFESEFEDAPDG